MNHRLGDRFNAEPLPIYYETDGIQNNPWDWTCCEWDDGGSFMASGRLHPYCVTWAQLIEDNNPSEFRSHAFEP